MTLITMLAVRFLQTLLFAGTRFLQVKPVDQITSKWTSRAGAAASAYTDGVKAPRRPWAATTAAAENNWKQGVTAAAGTNRFSAGVNAAGDSAWQNGAVNKGSSRYGSGVQAAATKFSSSMAKVVSVLSSVTLPPRFPKGDPQNIARVQAVATALRNAKVGK